MVKRKGMFFRFGVTIEWVWIRRGACIILFVVIMKETYIVPND